MPFKQFASCEPKASKKKRTKNRPTGLSLNVMNTLQKVITIKDDTKNSVVRTRWGNAWYDDDKPNRLKMQEEFRVKATLNPKLVFTGETKSDTGTPTGETKSDKSDKSDTPDAHIQVPHTKNVYHVELFPDEDEDETIRMYSIKITNTNDMMDDNWKSANFDFEKTIHKDTLSSPSYWTPYMQVERNGVYGEVNQFPIAIKSQWSERDGDHVISSSDAFKGLTDPNDVIDALLLHFPNGFGPYIENDGYNNWEFPINNDVFMIEIELFNLLSTASRQKLLGTGKNSLIFPNIWIVNNTYSVE